MRLPQDILTEILDIGSLINIYSGLELLISRSCSRQMVQISTYKQYDFVSRRITRQCFKNLKTVLDQTAGKH